MPVLEGAVQVVSCRGPVGVLEAGDCDEEVAFEGLEVSPRGMVVG